MRFLITFLFFILSVNGAYACSCERIGILKDQKYSDFVFTGKVVEINEIITQEKVTDSDRIVEYIRYEFVFKIKHIHKRKDGFAFKDKITIITTGGDSDCGNWFDLNKKYLVYAYARQNKVGWGLRDQKADKEFMTTHLCTRTKRIKFYTFFEQLVLELT
jgi:hypothetical protein